MRIYYELRILLRIVPRKAKTQELNEEHIIEMQALFESGNYSNVKITESIKDKYNISISEGTVRNYIKIKGWIKGRQKEYYNAKKFTKERETLAKYAEDESEAKVTAKVGKIAERKAREISEIKIKKQLEQEKAEEYAMQIRTLLLQDVLNVVQNGNASEGVMESFEYNQQGKMETKKIVSKSSKYKILNDIKYTELLKGLGMLQTQPTVAIQNNQSNTQEVKVESTEKAKEKAQNLLASAIE